MDQHSLVVLLAVDVSQFDREMNVVYERVLGQRK